MNKTCKKCGKEKDIEDFYKHPKSSDGHDSKCKECAKAAIHANRQERAEYYKAYDRIRGRTEERKSLVRERQKQNLGGHNKANAAWSARNKEKKAAQTAVSNALRDGKIFKLPCFVCGCLEVEGHHPDYSAPLDVVWLCVEHHKELHRKYDADQDAELLKNTKKGSRWDNDTNSI